MPKPNLALTTKSKYYGVIGAGSFGTTIANLLAENGQVLLFARRQEIVDKINQTRRHKNVAINENIRATNSLEEVAGSCTLIFPIVPSGEFRKMMKVLGPYLRPYHILIHGTKGLDISPSAEYNATQLYSREDVHTMGEVILQESVVVRVGCLSGPNLSAEIMAGQPAATVIASKFTEVIKTGQRALRSKRFQVFGSYDILGAEMAGALKNIIALGSGILGGLNMGHNIWGLLVSRGLVEMIYLGKAMGAHPRPFLGTAGIGDLVTTAASTKSRNYTFGMRLARGEKKGEILEDMEETVEGLRTLEVMKQISDRYKMHAPITKVLYKIIYDEMDIEKAIQYLMTYPYAVDVDFL